MTRGKQTCRILKDIRRQIAEANDIEYITSECQHKGDCRGTCPKCEAEVRYLEQQLEHRRTSGKAITLLGLSAGLIAGGGAITSCHQQSNKVNQPVTAIDSIAENDSTLLMGDICTDTIEAQAPGTPLPPPTELQMAGEMPLQGEEEYEQGLIVEEPLEGELVCPPDDDAIFEVVEEMPEYPDNGPVGLMKHIADNIQYSDTGDTDVQGRVIVRFVVMKDGSIADATVIRGIHPLFDKEALRVINSMPRWKPGKQRGEAVNVRYTVPVRFRQQ
ncbi:MAG: energy transducer TonB [Bacteroides sp.]|nr:energy transducer TonB [Bacteroides sp.]